MRNEHFFDISRRGNSLILVFTRHPKKNDPHSGVLAGFLRSGWGKVWGKNNLDLKAFDGQ
jgi:hypothetical protein